MVFSPHLPSSFSKVYLLKVWLFDILPIRCNDIIIAFEKTLEKTQNGDELPFNGSLFIVSKIDLKGQIRYANELFIQICEFSKDELIGAPHNILRHPDMPRVVSELLWDAIQSGEEIFAYIKNRTKTGKFYLNRQTNPHSWEKFSFQYGIILLKRTLFFNAYFSALVPSIQ